jgi:hypothetical protein
MWYYILFLLSFLFFNYNVLSIWFSFFLNLSCYLVPFLWENNFFFSFDFSTCVFLKNNLSVHYFYYENIETISIFSYFNSFSDSISTTMFTSNTYVNISNIGTYYLLWLEASVSRKHLIDFYSLQKQQILISGETSLSFYRIYNKSMKDILFYSVYVINPPSLSLFLVKVQCFCFEEILIGKQELIDLPILIYLDTTVLLESSDKWLHVIYLEYVALIRTYYT